MLANLISSLGASCSRLKNLVCALEKPGFNYACPMPVYLCPPRLNVYRDFLSKCRKLYFPSSYNPACPACKEAEIFLKDLVKKVSESRDPEEQRLTLLAVLSKYWFTDDIQELISNLPDGWWAEDVAKSLLIAYVTQGLYP